MAMPASVYWLMRRLGFSHTYIIYINDNVLDYLDEFPSGLTVNDWEGIAAVLYQNSSTDINDLMAEFVAAYGVS